MNLPIFLRPTFIAILCLFVSVPAVLAETRYVSDELRIMLRRGKGNQYKILRTLTSGTPVEVLDANKSNGYVQVKADGTVGYVLENLLMSEPSARTQLAQAQQLSAEAAATKAEFETAHQTLIDELTAKTEQVAALTRERDELTQQFTALQSATNDVQRVLEENRKYRAAMHAYEQEKEEIFRENQRLKDDSHRQWYIVGALTVVGGIIIGLILPLLRRRKRRWGEG